MEFDTLGFEPINVGNPAAAPSTPTPVLLSRKKKPTTLANIKYRDQLRRMIKKPRAPKKKSRVRLGKSRKRQKAETAAKKRIAKVEKLMKRQAKKLETLRRQQEKKKAALALKEVKKAERKAASALKKGAKAARGRRKNKGECVDRRKTLLSVLRKEENAKRPLVSFVENDCVSPNMTLGNLIKKMGIGSNTIAQTLKGGHNTSL